MEQRVAAVILAAGRASRFGSAKLLAALDGRPIVRHVVDAAVAAGLDPVVVVGPPDGAFDGLDLAPAEVVVNPAPDDGLSSSVRIGLGALAGRAAVEAAVLLPGDQPLVRVEAIQRLVDASSTDAGRPIVVPRYVDGDNPNPVLIGRAAWPLADELAGDRGFGPLIAARPELVHEVAVDGTNPDVDRPADLAALAEAAWGDRVRANREQVDRVREVPDGADFYAPVTSLFRADPRRTDEPVLDVLRGLVVPSETWLDIGAGAGRYALPLALLAGEVIAVDPSAGMLEALREGMTLYGIPNVRPVEARWPTPDLSAFGADVALIAHVGYDIELIGPFVAAMEAAARRLCVAVLMERQPSSVADVFWPPVHGEERVALPALPQFVELLEARGRSPQVTRLEREPRGFTSHNELQGFLRRQLWIADGGEKERRFHAALDDLLVESPAGFGLRGQRPLPVGVVTWQPR